MTDADNLVTLRGRVAERPELKTLPSGAQITTLRLIVDRSPAAKRRSRQLVDTFDCSLWTARLRDRALRLTAGERIEVTGALRRQFFRRDASLSSRVYVDVASLRRVTDSVTSGP